MRPRLDGYRWVSGRAAWRRSSSTTASGVGRSGSPMPREITSMPAARSVSILRSSSAKRYGGTPSRRLANFTEQLLRDLAPANFLSGPRQRGVEGVVERDEQVASDEVDRHRAFAPAVGH